MSIGKYEKLAERNRRLYPKGSIVILVNMYGEPKMPKGIKGIVDEVDDIGQIHVKWENGSSLALNVEVDSFRKVAERKITHEL
jgi:hypothetical protein